MANELSSELTRLLDRFDERRRGEEARALQARTESETFLGSFADLKRTVIRPVFERAGAILSQRGHAFTITEQEYSSEPDGKSTEASISIRIRPPGSTRPDDELPSLCIVTRHYNRTVTIRGAGGGRPANGSGPRGDYRLTQINTELIETGLLNLVAEFAGG